MPYNVPTVTTSDISFGPARVFIGAAGSTPTTDVGAITEDGVSIEITSEKRYITQGNPRVNYYNFTQAQDVMVSFTSIEWDFENFVDALGAGVTSTSGSDDVFEFGGDPTVDEVALHVQHYMASSGNTLNVYVWKATSAQGFTMPFGQDEHQFEFRFTAIASDTTWSGGSTTATTRLIKLLRDKS